MTYQSVTPQKLGQAAILTSATVVYTTPASTRTYLKEIDICNTTTAAISLYINLVPSGGSVATTNALLYDVSIPPHGTMQWTGSQVLLTGDFISVIATATGLTMTVSGGEAV